MAFRICKEVKLIAGQFEDAKCDCPRIKHFSGGVMGNCMTWLFNYVTDQELQGLEADVVNSSAVYEHRGCAVDSQAHAQVDVRFDFGQGFVDAAVRFESVAIQSNMLGYRI